MNKERREIRNTQIIEMRRNGASLREIGRFFNLSAEFIRLVVEPYPELRTPIKDHAQLVKQNLIDDAIESILENPNQERPFMAGVITKQVITEAGVQWALAYVERPKLRVPAKRQDHIDAVAVCAANLGLNYVTKEQYDVWRLTQSPTSPSSAAIIRRAKWRHVTAAAGLVTPPLPNRTYNKITKDEAVRAVSEYLKYSDSVNTTPGPSNYSVWATEHKMPVTATVTRIAPFAELIVMARNALIATKL